MLPGRMKYLFATGADTVTQQYTIAARGEQQQQNIHITPVSYTLPVYIQKTMNGGSTLATIMKMMKTRINVRRKSAESSSSVFLCGEGLGDGLGEGLSLQEARRPHGLEA